MTDILPVLDWLTGPGRVIGETQAFVEAFGEQLVAAGLPVDRVTSGIPILHPQIFSAQVVWEPDKLATERRWRITEENRHIYENSTAYVVFRGEGMVRAKVSPAPEADEFANIAELREGGFTDYVALPAPFSDGTTKAMTFATRRAEGFADSEVAALIALMPYVAPLLEIQTLRRTTEVLLETYVGRKTGRRVLQGQVKRGLGEDIRAILWFCDLRGYTEIADALGNEELIALLNDYFGAVVEAVEAQRGEVLKFIGDAVLAIFPIDTASSGRRAAWRALNAARAARDAITEINARRATDGQMQFQWGLALHAGEVHYGNVGGEARLDFTVIGPAVNLAARLQGLAARLGEGCVISQDFADLLKGGGALRDLGLHALKGVVGEQRVYGL